MKYGIDFDNDDNSRTRKSRKSSGQTQYVAPFASTIASNPRDPIAETIVDELINRTMIAHSRERRREMLAQTCEQVPRVTLGQPIPPVWLSTSPDGPVVDEEEAKRILPSSLSNHFTEFSEHTTDVGTTVVTSQGDAIKTSSFFPRLWSTISGRKLTPPSNQVSKKDEPSRPVKSAFHKAFKRIRGLKPLDAEKRVSEINAMMSGATRTNETPAIYQ